MEEIDLKNFFEYFKKYYLIVLVLIPLFITITYTYDVLIKKPVYTTYTTLVLVKDNSSYVLNDGETINQNDILLNQKLVSTYRQIVKSKLVLEQVLDELKLDYSLTKLSKEITVTALEDTAILKISVSDTNPKTAMSIANTIANVFEVEVSKIYNLENISILDNAEMPVEPSNNTFLRDVIIAFALAIVGGTMVVFVIYYFDDTLRESEEIEKEIDLPIIAKIYKDNSNTELIVKEQPKAVTSESIRTLRANLQFSSVDEKVQTILITSTMPSEGKSFVSANLAISFAQAEKKVLLIDCDLRKGRQHHIFGILSKKGLSNLLIEDDGNSSDYIYETNIPNLSLIPRGSFPPNPNELLSSKKMQMLLNTLKYRYDIIILDGAPCSGLSDSLALSSVTDRVLVVCSTDYTQKKALKETKKYLDSFGAKIAGCVVNNIKFKKHTYGYYSYNYGEKEKDNG